MNAAEWKQAQAALAMNQRELRDAVSRDYLVPSFHEKAIIAWGIYIRADGWSNVKVFVGHAAAAVRQTPPGNVIEIDALDIFALEALARTMRAVALWEQGERDELPTAEELELLDPKAFLSGDSASMGCYVIGQDHGTWKTEPLPQATRTPYTEHEVTDDTKLPTKETPLPLVDLELPAKVDGKIPLMTSED